MARDSRTEFAEREMRPLSEVSDVELEPQTQRAGKKVCTILPFRTNLEKALAFVVLILLLICVVVIALYALGKEKQDVESEDMIRDKICSLSKEARRVGLENFLQRVQVTYFKYNGPEWVIGGTGEDQKAQMEKSYKPMNFTPEYLKERTDAAMSLFNEIQEMDIDEPKLKPRETKAVYWVKQFLRTIFASAYDANFYGGDWMLGITHFCWQPICKLGYDLHEYSSLVQPRNLDDLENILNMIYLHGESVKQYQSNMKLGVMAGMVRSEYSCQSGLNAFKEHYKLTTKDNNPTGILQEPVVQIFREASYIKSLSRDDRTKWLERKGKSVSASIDEALVEGVGKPITNLAKYLENEHMRHCLPKDVSSGLAGLPVDFIYTDGRKTLTQTTRTLPITGQKLSGKEIYKNQMLPFFTTSDVSPEDIYNTGQEILAKLYPQVIEIARNMTGESDNKTAIREFKKLLNSSRQFFNEEPFPANESDAAAFKNCSHIDSAKLNCPKRWEALMKWINNGRQTLGMLAPKLIEMFYHTGTKITVPNCPLEFRPNFNPSLAAHSFLRSGPGCPEPTYIYLPFFVDYYGPKFEDWTILSHEGWPGHHTQIQGMMEYFGDQCGDILQWLSSKSSSTFFTEGWALYAEKPVISDDTDTYEGHPLEKYGMLKWQIWRALRLIVDTGLHYHGMTRTEALELFSEYAWEESDLSEKEVTRYQGVPGQATAYKLGQQKFIEMRKYCEQELGEKFDLPDFHYQILSMGESTEKYIDKHIKQYVKCSLDDTDSEVCDYILNPVPKPRTNTYGVIQRGYERISRPFRYQYL